MRFEHERRGGDRRWSFESDPWIERALAYAIIAVLGGGGTAIFAATMKALLGS